MAASGSLGWAIVVDAVLIVLAFVWLVVGSILKDEGILSISMAFVGGPLILLVTINMVILLAAFLLSKAPR